MAREPRHLRRELANAFLAAVRMARPNQRHLRVFFGVDPGTVYVFLAFPTSEEARVDNYRRRRGDYLAACCRTVKMQMPQALDIIGLATERGNGPQRSEDLLHLDGRGWTPEEDASARELQRKTGILTRETMSYRHVEEYPETPATRQTICVPMKGRYRNLPCPCGSGRKVKLCCGANQVGR